MVLAAIAVTAWPPMVSDDGGWRLADEAAARVIEEVGPSGTTPGTGLVLDSIPPFKSADALAFPLERRGVRVLPAIALTGVLSSVLPPDHAVVVCDPLFDAVVGAPCGGLAEDAWVASPGRPPLRLVDRFAASSRRVISIYQTGG